MMNETEERQQDIKMPRLKFIPLGGNGLVTKNMFVYEYGNDIIIVDCGMGFPSETMYGVDMVIPDISYLRDKKHKIRAILITHGHEDHIGALPFIVQELSAPIYATRLTVGLITVRLKEQNALRFAHLNTIDPDKNVQLTFGNFIVEPFRVTHSIPDSVGFSISTPIGTTVHTGDFKLDSSPLDGKKTDFNKLNRIANKGVLALMSDCLRSEKPGSTLSEATIQEKFDKAFETAPGRILITTFSSNISRIQQAINASIKFHRKVAVVGRAMENNVLTASRLGYLSVPKEVLIKNQDIGKYPNRLLTLIVSGSQGQPGSALSRIANADHSHISIQHNDQVIFSADPIPGNQDAVYETIDGLTRLGASITYSDITSDFHVSGHGAQEELLRMISLVKPRYLVPISGMYRQMRQYANIAASAGFSPGNIIIADEGDIVEFDKQNGRLKGKIDTTNIFVDGLGVGDVGSIVLRDRKVMAEEGIVVVVVTVSKRQGRLLDEPEIISRGFVYMKESADLIKEAAKMVVDSIGPDRRVKNWLAVKEKITSDLEKFLFKKTQRRPMVLPVIIDI